MAEINIKVTEIDNAIEKLQSLQLRCSSIDTTSPITVGGGKTVNELENIATKFKIMNINLENFITNTISFLQNARDSYVASDVRAAEGMTGKTVRG